MYKNSILIHNGVVEIHHVGLISTAEYYNQIELYVMSYLHYEGFLEDADGMPWVIHDVQIFDGMGKRIHREQLT